MDKRVTQMDLRTRKLTTAHKVLLPREDIDSLCQEKKKEEVNIKNCEDALIHGLEDHVEKTNYSSQ